MTNEDLKKLVSDINSHPTNCMCPPCEEDIKRWIKIIRDYFQTNTPEYLKEDFRALGDIE